MPAAADLQAMNDLRPHLLPYLVECAKNDERPSFTHPDQDIIVADMPLGNDLHVDLAVNDCKMRMHGFMVFGSKDTLAGFNPDDIRYGNVFLRMSVLASENHQAALLALLPANWGLLVARAGEQDLVLASIRTAEPFSSFPEPEQVVKQISLAGLKRFLVTESMGAAPKVLADCDLMTRKELEAALIARSGFWGFMYRGWLEDLAQTAARPAPLQGPARERLRKLYSKATSLRLELFTAELQAMAPTGQLEPLSRAGFGLAYPRSIGLSNCDVLLERPLKHIHCDGLLVEINGFRFVGLRDTHENVPMDLLAFSYGDLSLPAAR